MEYLQRQAAARRRLEQESADALLVSHLPNIRYLCGFSGSNGLLLLSGRGCRLFTDGRYREQVKHEVEAAQVTIPPQGDLWAAAAKQAARAQVVAVEAEHLTLNQRQRFLRHWPGPARQLRSAQNWVEDLRSVKDRAEIAALRRAVALASSVFEPTVAQIRRGMRETALAGELEYALRKAGGEGLAFETIIASGPRGARVHGHPAAVAMKWPGLVVMDYGVILGGYVSDMTRTLHLGPAARKARALYQVVREAQEAAIAAVQPGVSCAAVDAAARGVIKAAGWGEFFSHSTGHGVGLEIHEAPRIASTSKETLRAGQVITIEPGVYLPGFGGVRIEDVVLVREKGAEVLTPTTKEMLAVQ